MIDKLKSWWFEISGLLVVLLDQGFHFFNPVLENIGISESGKGWIRFAFAVYAIVRTRQQVPKEFPKKVQSVLSKIGLPKPKP